MKQTTRFRRIIPVAIGLTFVVSSACSRGAETTTPPQQTTAVPNNVAGPAGTIKIVAATASSGPDSVALAFDHDSLKIWNSGGTAPAWIQLDLGQPSTISRVRLLTAQSPAGPTRHELLGGLTPDSLAPLGVLEGETVDTQWLELQVKAQVRYVRVVTDKSPSWVAWREIEVYE